MPASRFRLDRALSLGLVHRASQLLDGHRQPRIPILMYHSIRADVGTTHPYFETRTSPQVFLRHMQFLSEDGYTTMDLGDAIAAIATGCKTQKCVALTFDDGYRDFYTHAFPILAE